MGFVLFCILEKTAVRCIMVLWEGGAPHHETHH